MTRQPVLAAVVTVLLTVACNKMPAYQVRTLPSGKTVKVMGIGRINFSKGGPALMLKYLTDVDVQDRAALRKEADEIWQAFKPDVEKAGMSNAILSANSFQPGIIQKGQGYNFVFARDSTGDWKCLADK